MDKTYIIIRVLIVLSVFVLPWWIVSILALLALFKFEYFFEIVLIGLFFDVIYGTHLIFKDLPYGLTLIATIILLVVLSIKKRLLI